MPSLENLINLFIDSQRNMHHVLELIPKMPRKWLIENIEAVVDPVLDLEGTSDYEYYQILNLYHKVDRALALRFAQHALDNPDPAIREMGENYLSNYSE